MHHGDTEDTEGKLNDVTEQIIGAAIALGVGVKPVGMDQPIPGYTRLDPDPLNHGINSLRA